MKSASDTTIVDASDEAILRHVNSPFKNLLHLKAPHQRPVLTAADIAKWSAEQRAQVVEWILDPLRPRPRFLPTPGAKT